MPQQPPNSDWDRYFGRNAPQRRGPVGLFIVVTLVIVFLGVAAFGLRFGAGRYGDYVAGQRLTSTPLWGEYYVGQTATALAQNAPPAAPTVLATRTTNVIAAGNVRSEPRIAPETVVGQVVGGDVLELLEERVVEGATWYRVRRSAEPVVEGWVSSTLVAPPAQ